MSLYRDAPLPCLAILLALFADVSAAEPAPAERFDDPPAHLPATAAPLDDLASERQLAATLYLAGRLRAQDQDAAGALRLFARAHRADPGAAAILAEIAPLAFEAERHAEAARYAVLAAEANPRNPVLLAKLAAYLALEHNYARAARLYEHALRLSPWNPDRPDGGIVKWHFELGRLRYLQGEAKQAAAALALVRDALAAPERFDLSQEAVENDFGGSPAVTHLLLADCFLAAGQWDAAEAEYRLAHRDEPQSPLAEFHLAQVDLARGDAVAALARLDAYFAAGSTAAGEEPYALLTRALRRQTADRLAADRRYGARLRELHRADPTQAFVALALARHERALGNLAAAVEPCVAAVRSDATAAGRSELLSLYRQLRRERELLALLAEVARESGSLAPIGAELAAIAGDPPLVDRLLAAVGWPRAAATPPPVVERGALFAAGLVALRANRRDAGRQLLLEAAGTGHPPRGEVLRAWAESLTQAGRHALAIEPLRLALEEPGLAGQRAEIHDALAVALARDRQFDEALRQAERAASLQAEAWDLVLRRPWVLQVAGRWDEAHREYRAFVLRHQDQYGSAELRAALRDARRALATLAALRAAPAEAEEWLEQILDEFPEDVAALNALAYQWAERQHRLGRALTFAQRAVAADSWEGAYRETLGWVYYRLGRTAEAVVELEEAVRRAPASGQAWEHLGDARLAAGEDAAARDAWRQAERAYERAGATKQRDAVRQRLHRVKT